MKSSIITPRDPYLMDPSLMVDPNLILDYGASFKDDSLCNPIDPLLDLINYNDTQLENIILNSDFCGSEYENPWAENEFEDLLKDIVLSPNDEVQPSESNAQSPNSDVAVCVIPETDVANYEEVYACADESESVDSMSLNLESFNTENVDTESIDTESLHSFSTESSSATRKRKLSQASFTSTGTSASSVSTLASAPKRRKTRRAKRVQDDRVKNQNKVAALKYRKKKKDEKDGLLDILEAEEEKNKKLKSSMEELKVNIDVLKELLGKYLSPNQLKFNSKK